MIWYIEKSGEAKEVPEEVLKYKIENNEISGDTLAVNEEIKNWVPLKETVLWKEYNSGGSGDNAVNFDLNSASHQWRCPKCGNMINKEPCPYCSNAQISGNTSTVIDTTPTYAANKKRNFGVFGAVAVIAIIVAVFALKNSNSKLCGSYIAPLDPFGYEIVTFADDNNGYVDDTVDDSGRILGTFGGTYSLKENTLTLTCTSLAGVGNVDVIYNYDPKNDVIISTDSGRFFTKISSTVYQSGNLLCW